MKKLLLGLIFSSCLFLCSCGETENTGVVYTMDTVVTVSIYNDDNFKEHFNKIKEIYKEVDLVSNDYKSGKDSISIYDLNHEREAYVSNTLLDILKESIRIYEKTEGYFNPFIGSLSHKWKDCMKENKVLDSTTINDELEIMKNTSLRIDGNHISIVGDGNIDLGGIAKGYATDVAKKYLEDNQISSYYIDAGNSSIAIGNKMGKEYTIGLSKPYDFNGYIGIIKDKDKVISCSSPQNQYVNIDGNIYHHLINPFNGYPSNKYDSIFVFKQNALEGDAYSTALFNMGFDKAVNFAKINNLDILMYSKDKILFQTEGVKLYE